MLPIIMGITAAVGSAITAGEAVVIGASIGAATVAGVNMMKKNSLNRQQVIPGPDEDAEFSEELERVIRDRLNRNKIDPRRRTRKR